MHMEMLHFDPKQLIDLPKEITASEEKAFLSINVVISLYISNEL